MKTVIQKGIAGVGNRFQVMGYCFDLAKKHNARLLVDWRDSSWGDNFSNYFDSDIIKDFQEGDYENVKPQWWSDKINNKCAKRLAGEGFVRADEDIINSQWETLAVCQYKAGYSNDIFKHVDFSGRIYCKYLNLGIPQADELDCWHIRATDKTAGDPQAILNSIVSSKTSNHKIIITDNLDIKNKAIKNGIYCISRIPPVPKRNGVHHSTDEYLRSAGITRRELNDSALVDLLIGKYAANFHSTCKNSSYSQLINRLREVK